MILSRCCLDPRNVAEQVSPAIDEAADPQRAAGHVVEA